MATRVAGARRTQGGQTRLSTSQTAAAMRTKKRPLATRNTRAVKTMPASSDTHATKPGGAQYSSAMWTR